MKRAFLIFLLSAIIQTSYSQSNISFDRLTTKEGLAHNQVRSIVQDINGFIWFGTTTGLQRYDGKKFTTYKNIPGDSNSLIGNRVRALLADDEGGIWIGTFGSGLSYLKDGKFTHYTYEENNPESISNNSIEALVKDKDGNLWVGTREGGLNRFRNGKFERYLLDSSDSTSLSHNGVFSLFIDSKDRLWVGTYGGGLNLFEDDKFIRLNVSNTKNAVVPGNFVISLYEDSKGSLWVGTWQEGFSVIHFNDEGWLVKNLTVGDGPNNSSVLTAVEHEGKMYLGTWGGGLNLVSGDKFQFYKNSPGDATSLSSNYIESLFVDKDGFLWIGTYGGGACRITFSEFITFRNNPRERSLNNDFVTDILEASDGTIWVGTLGGGLNRIKDGQFDFYQYDPAVNDGYGDHTNTIWQLIEASDQSIWIANQSGLDHYKDGKFKHYEFKDINGLLNNNLVYSVIEGINGEIIFGTWDGRLIKLENENFTVIYDIAEKEVTEANHPAFSIFQEENGNLWACLESVGLLQVNDGKISKIFFEWSSEKTNVPEPRDAIKSKFENTVWAGTSLGLYKINLDNDSLTWYNHEVGLVNDNIISVTEDNNGTIWVSTMEGVSRLNPKTEEFVNFDVSDGLQGNQFVRNSKYISSKTGKLYLGGTNGFNVFHPDSIQTEKIRPKVALTGLQVLYKDISPLNSDALTGSIESASEINLDHEDKVFGFDFATINYDRLYQQYQYAYFLENYEDDWNYVGTRTYASYNNIPPGEYVFKVKSSETGGDWDNPVTSLKVVIHPPWYYTLWAKIIAAVVVLGFIAGVFRLRIRSIERRNIVLKRIVDKRTSELSDSNDKLKQLNDYKEQMTSMVVHDLKNPLNTIFGMGEKQEVVEAANQMLNLVNNMLEIHKFEEAELQINVQKVHVGNLVNNALQQVKHQADRKSIVFQKEMDRAAFIKADEEIIARVLVNLLTNAIKFSPTNAVIQISSHELPESWQISIKDSGPGLPEGAKKAIFAPYGQLEAREYGITPSTGLGLTFCKHAIKAHNGFIGVYSKLDQGATFYFTLAKADSGDEEQIDMPNDMELEVQLSAEDKEYLLEYVEKLRHYEIYEFTKISRVIEEIETKSDNLTKWKESFKNAIYSSNTMKFKELIEQV